MDKIAKLASEHTATRVVAQQTASVAAADPTEKQRKMPRRETPLARIVREGASKTAQEASGSQEAMDAETTPASEAGKAAAPAPEVQNPSWCKVIEEKLEAILAAVNRVSVRVDNLEVKVETLSVKHERLAARVNAMAANNTAQGRLAALRKKRNERLKASVANRRGRLETAEEDEENK